MLIEGKSKDTELVGILTNVQTNKLKFVKMKEK